MKRIELVSMEIRNFKGIEILDIEFSHRTEIFGRNGVGKTSILDAFLWCLFGKDSTGASAFSIKPLNPDGTMKEHHDVDVLCTLAIDGETKNFRRRWVEKRSKKGDVFKGNEGAYFVNEVPIKEAEYQQLIADICREDLFKLITATGAFNRMKDADRRNVLAGMSDTFSDEDIAIEFPSVLKALQEGKSVEQFRAEIKSKKSRVNLDLEQYPTRLKENADSRPTLPEDIGAYPETIAQIDKEIKSLENKMSGVTTSDNTLTELQSRIDGYEADLKEITQQCRRSIDTRRGELTTQKSNADERLRAIVLAIARANTMLATYLRQQSEHQQIMADIKEEWAKVNSSTVETNVDTVCPTCGKPFSQYDIDVRKNEIVSAFNADKLKRLEEINKRGYSEQQFLEKIDSSISELRAEIAEKESEKTKVSAEIAGIEKAISELPTLELMLSANAEYQTISNKCDEARVQLRTRTTPSDIELEIKQKIETARKRKSLLNAELAKLAEIQRLDERKAELEKKQTELGQALADYERIEAEILAFSMKKTDMIEQSISDKFRFVKFKMFEYNISNDGVREVCICTVNGVPYKDLNTAMQYNADIDIINALSTHYGIIAPVFIDRAESINKIEDTESQRIDLYATKEDSVLRIQHII